MLRTLVPALLLSLFATTTFAGWSSSGPTGGQVNAVVVAPSDPAVIWAGNSAGVFRSTDGGATWANVSGPVVDVAYLVVHPSDANKAWALTGSANGTYPLSRLFRTADGGATWIDSTGILSSIRPSALLIDPHNPDTLYAGSGCDPRAFAVGPRPLAFSHGPGAGVYKSTDGGATWNVDVMEDSVYQPCVAELTLDPFSPWRIFVTGAFREDGQTESYDSGNTWEPAGGPRPGRAVVFDARYPFTHYGISGQFVVSQDGGFTWASVGVSPPASPRALSMDPEHSRIFLGTDKGVWRSGNGGTVWAKTSVQTAGVNALDFGGVPRSLFAATTEGLYQMRNRGLGDARLINLGDASADVISIAVDPSDTNVVYAGVLTPTVFGGNAAGSRFFRSTNGGVSWQGLLSDDAAPRLNFLAIDAAGTVYAGGFAGPLYRHALNDLAWTIVHDGSIVDVAADPKNAGTVFVSGAKGLERSRDSGATWTAVQAGGILAIDPSDPRWVYAGNRRSSDGGDSWTTLDATSGPEAMAVAPSNGSVLYRITSPVGLNLLERSDDRAATWHLISNGFYPVAFAIDPRNENSVWASASGGALDHSTDGGASWQQVDGPFPTGMPAVSLRFGASGHVLHAAYPNHGVWELTVE